MQPNSIYRFKAIPTKISGDFFVEIDKLIVKFIWKFKGDQNNLETEQSRRTCISQFQN